MPENLKAKVVRSLATTTLGFVALTQVSACSTHRPPVLFPQGSVAESTRDLLFSAVGLMLIVIVPVFAATAFVVWRYRAGSHAKYAPDWGFSWPIDIVVWVVPLAIIATLGTFVWTTTHKLDPYRVIPAPGHPLEVEVVALDWKWLFIYPEQHIATVNRLVLPAARSVTLKITSDTVMNAFAVPALGGQIYAMAGMQTQLNLLANEVGTFEGHNTQFSGVGFPEDRFVVQAVTEQNFEAFVADTQRAVHNLDTQAYSELAKPSVNASVDTFSHVDPHLYASIVAKYDDHVTLPARHDILPKS